MRWILLTCVFQCACQGPVLATRSLVTLDDDEQGPCREQRWVEDDGTLVWAPEGVEQAPIVLFLHGAGGAPADHDSAQRLLARRGYTVVVPPLPAEGDLVEWTRKTLQRHLEVTLTGAGDPRWVAAVGDGLGGEIALALASDRRVKAAVAWAPSQTPSTLPRRAKVLTPREGETPAGFADALPKGQGPEAHFAQLRRARRETVMFLDGALGVSPAGACPH